MPANDRFAIWGRIIKGSWGGLKSNEARAILMLKFEKEDLARVEKLSALARKGTITQREQAELDEYLYMGRMLALMKSSARRMQKAAKGGSALRRRAS